MLFSLPFYLLFLPVAIYYWILIKKIKYKLQKNKKSSTFSKEELKKYIYSEAFIKTKFYEEFVNALFSNYNYFQVINGEYSLKKLFILLSIKPKNSSKYKDLFEKNLGFEIDDIGQLIKEEKAWWKVLDYKLLWINYNFLLSLFFKSFNNFRIIAVILTLVLAISLSFTLPNLINKQTKPTEPEKIQKTQDSHQEQTDSNNNSNTQKWSDTNKNNSTTNKTWEKQNTVTENDTWNSEKVAWEDSEKNKKWEPAKQLIHQTINEIVSKFKDKGYVEFLLYLAFGFFTTLIFSSIFYRLFKKIIPLYVLYLIWILVALLTLDYTYLLVHYLAFFAILFGFLLYVMQLILSIIPKKSPIIFEKIYYFYRFLSLIFFIFSLVSLFWGLLYVSSEQFFNAVNSKFGFDLWIAISEQLKLNAYNILYWTSLSIGLFYYLIFYKIDLVIRDYFKTKSDKSIEQFFKKMLKIQDENNLLKALIASWINKRELSSYIWKFLYNLNKIEWNQFKILVYIAQSTETPELKALSMDKINFPANIYIDKFNEALFDKNINLWFEREVDRTSISFLKEANKHERVIHKENLNCKKSIALWKTVYNEYEVFDSEKAKDYNLVINIDKILEKEHLSIVKSIIYRWMKKWMKLKNIFFIWDWVILDRFIFDWFNDFNDRVEKILQSFEYNYYHFVYPSYLKIKGENISKIDIMLSYSYGLLDLSKDKISLDYVTKLVPARDDVIYVWFDNDIKLKNSICL